MTTGTSKSSTAVTSENHQHNSQRWVIKIGSALISNNGRDLAHAALDKWVPQIAALIRRGEQVVLVSSGAVSEGVKRLGWQKRPDTVHELQAAAAIGQAGLIQAYESRFQRFDIQTAQILLVRGDLASRDRYLNARQTLKSLLQLTVIPIVNENDTVATDEIRFGDNDTLAGLAANLIDADKLLILTDQKGVYTDDPRKNPQAKLINSCDAHDKALDTAARGSGNALGRGGMQTKIRAARLAARSGTTTIIANGNETDIITRISNNEAMGTTLTSSRKPITARKQWLAGSLQVKGSLQLDNGAINALKNTGVSLLPIGVKLVEGNFQCGELVSCVDEHHNEIARGLTNYNAHEAKQVAGKSGAELNDTLGYTGEPEIIHRDNLVLL